MKPEVMGKKKLGVVFGTEEEGERVNGPDPIHQNDGQAVDR